MARVSHKSSRVVSSPEPDEDIPAELPRPKRHGRPSTKKKQNDDDEITALKKRLEQVQRQNVRLAKKGKYAQDVGDHHGAGRSGEEDAGDGSSYESEEQDLDEDSASARRFHSSFESVGVVEDEPRQQRLRRAGEPRNPSQQAAEAAAAANAGNDEDGPGSRGSSPAAEQSETSNTALIPSRRNKRPRADSLNASQCDVQPTRKKTPPFKNNQTPTGSTAKAGDYDPYVRRLILLAIRDFESRVVTEEAFPSSELQAQWAIESWSSVQTRPNEDAYDLPDRILGIITDRTSRIRGALRDKIRPLINTSYDFSCDGTPEATKANYLRYQLLMNVQPETGKADPIFHYKDIENKRWYARHPLILQALRDAWFPSNGQKLGLQFRARFDPLPIKALALIFTTINYCLDQWADGKYDQHLDFTEHSYKSEYSNYVTKLEDWEALNPAATRKIRKEMHDNARRSAGASVEETTVGLLPDVRERARAELEEEAASANMDAT